MTNPNSEVALTKKQIVVHPILLALFPILFFYAHNITEASANGVWMPMLFSTLGTLALWSLLVLLMKNMRKAGLATTIFVIFFFSYGHLYDLLVKRNIFVPGHAYLFPAALLVWGYCVYFINIIRRDFRNTTKILNVAAIFLVSVNLVSITLYEINKRSLLLENDLKPANDVITLTDSIKPSVMPDIYYIILDEYAHPSTMLEYYNYDNSDFINWLVEKGFFVASNSSAPNPGSFKSISSYLNMEYLPDGESDEFYYERIQNSTVANFFKSMGYRYVYFGSWIDKGKYKVNADLYYNTFESDGGSVAVDFFSRMLWNSTMAKPFYDRLTGSTYRTRYRSAIAETIQLLKMMPDIKGPKFVFAHIMSPHDPFVFGPNGEYVDPANWFNTKDKQFYLGQYRFISKEIEGVVAALLEKSVTNPVIILQSDHGLRSWVSGATDIGESEWRKILNAYYLPGDGKDDLYDAISPVNTFRVIANRYFEADYDLLK